MFLSKKRILLSVRQKKPMMLKGLIIEYQRYRRSPITCHNLIEKKKNVFGGSLITPPLSCYVIIYLLHYTIITA